MRVPLRSLRRLSLRAIVVLMAAGLLGGWLVTVFTPRVYATTAVGMLRYGAPTSPEQGARADALANARAAAYAGVAQGEATADRVMKRLGLEGTPSDVLLERITVTHTPAAATLSVRATAPTANGAQQLANAWLKGLAEQVQAVEDPKKAGKALRLVTVEAAPPPGAPVSPDPVRNLLIGLAIGTLVGLAVATVRALIGGRVRDVESVTRDFGLPVVGVLPTSPILIRQVDGNLPMAVIGARGADRSHAAQGFFKIRANLQFLDVDNPPRVIVVTSPLPVEGKTMVAANLAAAVAETGQSVILLDGNLRHPTLAAALGLTEGAGLTDLLSNQATLAEVGQQATLSPTLTVVPAGSTPPNPGEMLGSNAMRQLLQVLRRDFLVIIDAPAVLQHDDDAAVLAAQADGALLVITAARTRTTKLTRALARIEHAGGRALGVIINKVPTSSMGAYYGHYGATGSPAGKKGATPKPVKAETRRSDGMSPVLPISSGTGEDASD